MTRSLERLLQLTVPREERERIFQSFYRIPRDSAGVTDEGSDLGFAIVTVIAEHSRSVEITEAPTSGSVFCLVLGHPAS